MKAIILAAGLGTRLRPLTDTVPKPMLPLAGRPLLQHLIEHLARYGISQIAINLHYLPEQITGYFSEEQSFGVRFTWLYEPQLSGTAGAIKKFEGFLREVASPFLVLYGDNFTTIRIDRLAQVHNSYQPLATIALYPELNPEGKGVVDTNAAGRVLAFKEKPKAGEIPPTGEKNGTSPGSYWANAGIYLLAPEILNYIPAACFCDFGHDVFPALLAANKLLWSYRMDEYLIDIGTPAGYARAQQIAAP
ncbi:MAG: nucleotidyltransferase family protein [Chloroflexi bacterium]|nr:nucleotidyltransferase family protein [Chloroflexota bacterium]